MTSFTEARFARRLAWLLLIAALAATIGVAVAVWPLGPDYYYTYQQVSRRWLSGETRLYDARSRGFYNAPWTLILTVPLSLFPVRIGNGLLNTMSLLSMLAAIRFLRGSERAPIYALLLPLANLHTFDLLIRGQIDALVLLGVALGWFATMNERPLMLSMGFWLMSIKPQNVLLVIALFLWSIRRWPLREWIAVFSLPLLSLLVSSLVIGFDWPIRYWSNLQIHPPLSYLRTTIWRGAAQLGVARWPLVLSALLAVTVFVSSVKKEGASRRTLSIALATNLLLTPYALGYHYVLLIPAMFHLALDDWRAGLLAYLVTWSPLLRLRWGFDIAWIDAAYPMVLLAGHSFPFLQRLVVNETPGSIRA
jgi:hypothetical protein